MIHHVSVGTNDLDRAQLFYDPIMKELGVSLIKRTERILAYGLTEVVFSVERPCDGKPASAGNGVHVAFLAGHRNVVDACHRIGLSNGGLDHGAPGLREQFDPNYYAAFLKDPAGNKIEIVTFSGN